MAKNKPIKPVAKPKKDTWGGLDQFKGYPKGQSEISAVNKPKSVPKLPKVSKKK